MNKSKLFVLTALSALLILLLCACNANVPPVEETQTKATEVSVTTGVADTTAEVNGEENTVSAEEATKTDSVELPSQGENDLDIITVPRTEAEMQTDAQITVTETVDEPTGAENETTEVQKIELPFVPAN